MKIRVAIFFLVLAAALASAQTSPFLPPDLYRKLTNEISGDIAFDHLRTLTQFHSPNGASRDFRAEAQWLAGKAREVGLEDVKIVDLPYDGLAWSPLSGELWLVESGPDSQPVEKKLGSYAEVATSIADYSRPTKLEADLIDVGSGTEERDYQGKDVSGKVVLASGPPAQVESEAVWKRGAVGIVSYWSSRINPSDYPEQIAWSRIHSRPDKEGHQPSFAFMVSWRTGMELKRRLNPHRVADMFAPEGSKEQPGEPLRVRVNIESEIAPGTPTQQIVEGWIRGSKVHDQQVVLTAHIQEEKTSANDDRSGCANVLEIARALVKMIHEGKLPRPERDIRFWWANEISAEYEYFAQHPEERKNIFVNINQDMVGVNPAIGGLSRVQHVTRTPWSRPTFFNDVVESVVMSLYYGNNSYLAARQAGHAAPGSPYTRPIYSLLGSRDRYSVEIVPYFDSTDHMVFDDAWIGATHGGITFTNWPDEYIHSSDDDMWQMDRTMFQRNAVAVSALAWFMANAGPDDVKTIGSVLVPNATRRIYRDLSNAMAAFDDGQGTNWDIGNVLAQAVAREQETVDSIATIAAGSPEAARVKAYAQALADSRAPAEKVAAAASWSAGGANPAASREMTSKIPVRIDSVADYLTKRRDMKPTPGLHGLMAYEALNFADGKRSVWDIYAAVRAESLATGEWYYGTVTPEMIQKFFENAAAAGIVTMKEAPAAAPGDKKPAKKKP